MATNANKNLNQQPKAFKGNIGVDTRQTQYKPAKEINYRNKMKEYNPPNKYYNTQFDSERAKAPKQVQPKPEPKPEPKPQPKPQPKAQPKPKEQPKQQPKHQSKAQPKPQSQPKPKPSPQAQPIQPEPDPEPEYEQWGEPVHQQPIAPVAAAPAKPVAVPIGPGLPSSVGSMNRMFSLFN